MSKLSAIDKAQILLETVPWLRQYSGKRVVIKYGGNAMVDEDLKRAFAQDILFLHAWGVHPIVVHGGGPQINEMLRRVSLTAPFSNGLRVTTPEVMEIVRMVLQGKVQREIVSLLNADSVAAVGLSGEDARLLTARRRTKDATGKIIDIGQVGDVVEVNAAPIDDLISTGRIPVISTVAVDVDSPSDVLNVNADSAAAAIAVAANAAKLIMLTDVAGVYRNYPDPDSLIQRMGPQDVRELLPTVDSGMIPKLQGALDAIEAGVPRIHIIDGRQPHSMLLEIFTDEGAGTMIYGDEDTTLKRRTQ
ncbi:MAG: acetylglutamate kinase [Actinomycetaceae bacterium]|nr:acetylglutamate kinase [Actinomycetaceae bacterium]